MNNDELRKQFNSAPDWAYVGLAIRIEALEKKLAELEQKKPSRKKAK